MTNYFVLLYDADRNPMHLEIGLDIVKSIALNT